MLVGSGRKVIGKLLGWHNIDMTECQSVTNKSH